MKEYLMQDESTGKIYCDWQVVTKLYKLVCDQQAFYHTRSKKLLKLCKDREQAFMIWFQEQQARIEYNKQ